jgi:uncharacterized protein YeaO (DUF488 family)
MIRLKRAYDPPARGDGRRFLVERLWPRGVRKEDLHVEAWLKDVAPSTELRRWFAHDVERWDDFRRRYTEELRANPEAWAALLDAARRGTVTLVYAARDVDHNSAIVLRTFLDARLRARRPRAPRAEAPSTVKARRRA